MAARQNSGGRGNLAISILLVSILSLAAAALLLFAFVIWFAELIDSLVLSLCITGTALSAAAWVSYKLTLSPTLKRLREEYEHAMTIISLIRYGYERAVKRIAQCLSIFE